MATINNAQAIKGLIDKAKINIAVDRVPTELAEKVVPVMEVAPKILLKVHVGNLSDTATATLFTTSATKKTFVVGVGLSIAKDINSTSIYSRISLFPFGSASADIIRIRYEPVTAGQFFEKFMFPIPLKLAKNTAITLTHEDATPSIDGTSFIYFYEEE